MGVYLYQIWNYKEVTAEYDLYAIHSKNRQAAILTTPSKFFLEEEICECWIFRTKELDETRK